MNNYSQLSAESEVDSLAVVHPGEVFTDEQITFTPRINHAKLTRYNLTKPLDRRISLVSLVNKVSMARTRGNNAALLAKIHMEIAIDLAVMQSCDWSNIELK